MQKQKLIISITDALEKGTPLIVLSKGADMTALGLQGDPISLSMLVAEAMKQDQKFEQVFTMAVKAFKEIRGKKSDRPHFLDFLMSLLDFKPLDCDNCPVADNCEVRDEIHCAKEMPEELRDLLKEVFNNREGKK